MPIDQESFIKKLQLFKEDESQAVRLNEQNLTPEHLPILFAWLKKNYPFFNPEILDLSGNNLSDVEHPLDLGSSPPQRRQQLSSTICDLIEGDINERNKFIWKEIDLSDNRFFLEESDEIIRSLNKLKSLRYFAFNGQRLSEYGFQGLLQLIQNNPDLERLSLKSCYFTDGQMAELTSMLKEHSPYLKELDVGGNWAFGHNGFTGLLQFIQNNRNLEKLSLADCHLMDEHMVELALALKTHSPHFKELDLGGDNSYGQNGLLELVELIEKNHGIIKIEINRNNADAGLRYIPLDDRLASNKAEQATLHAKIKNPRYRFTQLKEALQDPQMDSFQVLLGPSVNDRQKYDSYFELVDLDFMGEKAREVFHHRAFQSQESALNALTVAPSPLQSEMLFSTALAEVAETATLGAEDGIKAHKENDLVMPELIKLMEKNFRAYVVRTLPLLKFQYNSKKTLEENKALLQELVENATREFDRLTDIHRDSESERQKEGEKILADRLKSLRTLERQLTTLARGEGLLQDITHHYREIKNYNLLSEPFDLDWQEPGTGRTLLHYAFMLDKPEHMKLLLERKADVLKKDANGKSVLMYILEHFIQHRKKSACHDVVFDYLNSIQSSLIPLRWGNDKPLHVKEEKGLLQIKQHVDRYMSGTLLKQAERSIIWQIFSGTYPRRKLRAEDCEEFYRRIRQAIALDANHQSVFTDFIRFASQRLRNSSSTGALGNSVLYQNVLTLAASGYHQTLAERELRSQTAEACRKSEEERLAREAEVRNNFERLEADRVADAEKARQDVLAAQEKIQAAHEEIQQLKAQVQQAEVKAQQAQVKAQQAQVKAQQAQVKAQQQFEAARQEDRAKTAALEAQMASMFAMMLQNMPQANPGSMNIGQQAQAVPIHPVTAPFLSHVRQDAVCGLAEDDMYQGIH